MEDVGLCKTGIQGNRRFQATIRVTAVMENLEDMIMDIILLSIRKIKLRNEQKLYKDIIEKVNGIDISYIVITKMIMEKGRYNYCLNLEK